MTETMPELDPTAILEHACALVLDDLPFPLGAETPTKRTFAVTSVGPGVSDLIAEHGAVVHVHRAGGLSRSWQLTAREIVDVYAASETDACAAQAAIEAIIGGPYRPNTQSGDGGIRIDSWRNESAATKQPYPGLEVLSSIWRVSTRHMPA